MARCIHNFHEILILNLLHIYSGYVSFKKISLHISREWASIHFFATRPDSHSTISIIAWYLTLKNWNFSVYTRISTRNLTIFEPTRPNSTRPFDTRSDSYSTNLPLAHSLHISCEINQFREVSSCCSFLKPNSQWFRFNLIPSSISSYK